MNFTSTTEEDKANIVPEVNIPKNVKLINDEIAIDSSDECDSDEASRPTLLTCVLCHSVVNEFGNNPEPFALLSEGRCCNDCNRAKVLPARFHHLFSKGDSEPDDLDYEKLDMGEKPLTRIQVNAEKSLKLAEVVTRVREDVNVLADTVLRLDKEKCELKDLVELMYFKHYTMKPSGPMVATVPTAEEVHWSVDNVFENYYEMELQNFLEGGFEELEGNDEAKEAFKQQFVNHIVYQLLVMRFGEESIDEKMEEVWERVKN